MHLKQVVQDIPPILVLITLPMKVFRKYWWVFPLLLGVLIYFLGDPILTRISRKALNTSLEKAFSGKTYTADFRDLEVSLLDGNLVLKDLVIRQAGTSQPTKGLLSLRIRDTRLQGFSAWNILRNNRLHLRDIQVSDMDLLMGESLSVSDSASASPGFVPREIEFMGLEQLTLDQIQVGRVRLRRFYKKGDTTLVYEGRSAQLQGLQLVEAGKKTLKPEFDAMLIRLKNQKYGILNGDYLIQYDSLLLSTKTNSLQVFGLDIAPEKEKFELADSYSTRRDVYDFKLPRFTASGFQFRKLLEQGELRADSLALEQASLGIYISTRLPKNLNRKAVFPQQSLRQSPLPVHLRTLSLRDGDLIYKELHGPDKSNFNIALTFDELEAGPFYSDQQNTTAKAITLNSSGVFLKAIPYRVALRFPFATPDQYAFDGHTGSFDMQVLNDLLVPFEAVKIQEGKCLAVDFNSLCLATNCSGSYAMRYRDLKIDLLQENRNDKKGLQSFFANILIRQNNPVGDHLKTVPMDIEREPHQSFIKLLHKSLVEGMKQTIKP